MVPRCGGHSSIGALTTCPFNTHVILSRQCRRHAVSKDRQEKDISGLHFSPIFISSSKAYFWRNLKGVTNQAKVGIFSAITIAVFVLGFYFLKGIDLFERSKSYYAVYDRVEGVYTSTPVELNGFPVGRVGKMGRDPKTGKIVVQLDLNKDVAIPRSENTRAVIFSSDMLGSKKIRLVFGEGNTFLEDGDTLNAEFQVDLSEQINPIIGDFKGKIVPKADTTIANVQWLFSENNPKGIYSTLGNLNVAIGHVNVILQGNEQNLNLTIKNLQSISKNIEKNNAAITAIINNANGITDSLKQANLKQMIDNMNVAVVQLDSVIYNIKEGNGTVGKLVNSDQLYTKLDSTVSSLNHLLVDVKQRPYRYINVSVFGSKKREKRIEEKYNESGK